MCTYTYYYCRATMPGGTCSRACPNISLYIVYCILCVVYCIVYIVYCVLYVV